LLTKSQDRQREPTPDLRGINPILTKPLSAFPRLRGISPSLAKPLSAFPGLRGISPSLDKKSPAGEPGKTLYLSLERRRINSNN